MNVLQLLLVPHPSQFGLICVPLREGGRFKLGFLAHIFVSYAGERDCGSLTRLGAKQTGGLSYRWSATIGKSTSDSDPKNANNDGRGALKSDWTRPAGNSTHEKEISCNVRSNSASISHLLRQFLGMSATGVRLLNVCPQSSCGERGQTLISYQGTKSAAQSHDRYRE